MNDLSGLFDFAAAQAARQSDRATRIWADHAVRLGAVRITSGGAWQRAALRYTNPSLGVDDEGRTRIATAHTRAERTWTVGGGAWTAMAGGQLGDGVAAHPSLAEGAHERTAAAVGTKPQAVRSFRWAAVVAAGTDSSRACRALSDTVLKIGMDSRSGALTAS